MYSSITHGLVLVPSMSKPCHFYAHWFSLNFSRHSTGDQVSITLGKANKVCCFWLGNKLWMQNPNAPLSPLK